MSAVSLPFERIRSDLVVSRLKPGPEPEQSSAAGGGFVVKEPTSGRFFRFGEIEGYLLEQLDGTNSLQQIQQRVQDRFGAPLPTATIEQFVDRLRRLGLLERPAQGENPKALPQRRVRGSLFYLRLRAFNPDRLFDRWIGKLGFFFTPTFVVLSTVMIFAGALITASQWWQIVHDVPRLYTLESFLFAYVVVLGVVTAHEFAHGLTCKHFGGSVREIGFLLLYFQPAFYCNVSDAWLFPEKSKRLWVSFAGAYFEIFLWSLATIVWRVTDPYTLINYVALVVMATSGVKTLFNLNPLIKLDGYYLLSDLLEVPNLRQRAIGHIGNWLRNLWGATVRQVREATPRERRIYWVYGLLAWAYSTSLLSGLAWYVGGALVRRYQGFGFVVFSVLLAGVFQQPLKNLLRAPLGWVSVRTTVSKWVKRLVWLCILGAGVTALFVCRTELKIGGSFLVLPVHNADVRAEVEGILQEIYADEGNAVAKGAPIAALSDRDFQADLRKIKAEIEEKDARLKLLKAGARPEEIELAVTLASKAEERLRYATNLHEMDRTLFAEKLISKREFEETREQVGIRGKEVQEAKDKLKLLLAGSRQEEIEATAAELSRLQAHQRYLQEQLQLLKVFSPIEGIVTTHKLKDKVGQAVRKGDLIAKVHAMRTVTVEIAIPEKEIADIKVGQKVVLKARAYPQSSFEGQVNAIAPVATEPDETGAERTVLVTTQLENKTLLLKPEMTGHAKIYAGEQRLIDIVMRRVVRFFKVEFWSWW